MPVHANQACVKVAGTTTSADEFIPANFQSKYIRVLNLSAAAAFIKTGVGATTATITSAFVGPNETVILEKDPSHDTVAAILSTGTGDIYVMPCGAP